MERLLYISESQIDDADAQSVVADIVAGAQVKNFDLGITGTLFFTGTYFAQILEGPRASVGQLMSSIIDDVRHTNIEIFDRSPITTRTFADWKMAYYGPSQFVSRHLVRLLNCPSPSEERRATKWLTELAHEFSGALAA